MGTIRKSVLKENKEARRKSEGLPRLGSQMRAKKRLMKEYSKFAKRQALKQELKEKLSKMDLKSHEDVGLPEEISGEDYQKLFKHEEGSV